MVDWEGQGVGLISNLYVYMAGCPPQRLCMYLALMRQEEDGGTHELQGASTNWLYQVLVAVLYFYEEIKLRVL